MVTPKISADSAQLRNSSLFKNQKLGIDKKKRKKFDLISSSVRALICKIFKNEQWLPHNFFLS